MSRSPFHVNILQHFLHPAAPLTWPALPRSCPLSSCRFSSSSQCFTPGKSAPPSSPPTPSPLSSYRGLRAGVPLAGVCNILGAREGQRALPPSSAPCRGFIPKRAFPRFPPRDPPGPPVSCSPAAAAVPAGPRREAAGRPRGLCPQPARQKVFPLRRQSGSGPRRGAAGAARAPLTARSGRRSRLPSAPHPRGPRGRGRREEGEGSRGKRQPSRRHRLGVLGAAPLPAAGAAAALHRLGPAGVEAGREGEPLAPAWGAGRVSANGGAPVMAGGEGPEGDGR